MATKGQKPQSDLLASFGGFQNPQSNTTYTPNQFFDLVLRDAKTTGVVRAVAYVLRKTLGWSNPDGSPQETDIITDYNHLIHQAGISRAKVREALDECLSRNFLTCIRRASPDQYGKRSVSALYCLHWDDDGEYTTDQDQFSGFFSGEGNRTYIPNQFFDLLIPNENLSVIKVVGAIIRHTIGFQNRYGHRKQEVSMSVTHLMRVTKMGRQAVRLAIKRALEVGYITKIKEGSFDHSSEQQNKAATYGIRWEANQTITTSYGTTSSQITTGKFGGEKRTGSQITTGGAVHKSPPTGSQLGTGAVHKSPPHINNTLKIKPKEITTTGATTCDDSNSEIGVGGSFDLDFLRGELQKRGVSERGSFHLTKSHDPQTIADQIEHFDFLVEGGKKFEESAGGWLRNAITQNFGLPTSFKTSAQRAQDERDKRSAAKARAEQQLAEKAQEEAQRAEEEREQERRDAISERYLSGCSDDEIADLELVALRGHDVKNPDLRRAVLYNYVYNLLMENGKSELNPVG